jgi:hypothetical protein
VPPRVPAIAMAMILIGSSADMGRAQSGRRVAPNDVDAPTTSTDEVTVTGWVEHVYAPRLFTIMRDEAGERELLVFAPTALLTPRSGSRLRVHGAFRRCQDAFDDVGGSAQVDELTGRKFVSQPVLIARSFDASAVHQAPRRASGNAPAAMAQRREDETPKSSGGDSAITVRPGVLADLIESLAGHAVRLRSARVVGVFDPRVFLIETQTRLRPLVDRNRILVFVDAGALRVPPAALVASTVTVSGVARTLLGMQVSREVPWPAAVTPDVVTRLEIRAAVLATAVRTDDGVDLLIRSSVSPTAR